MNTVDFNVKLELSDEVIGDGDLFFFRQHDGLPTIRRAKEGEKGIWVGESYKKITKISGVLISPKIIFGNLTSF